MADVVVVAVVADVVDVVAIVVDAVVANVVVVEADVAAVVACRPAERAAGDGGVDARL